MRYETPEQAACKHHWIIDPAGGKTSEGRCKSCGVQKSFLNVFDDVVAELEARGVEPQAPVAAALRRAAT